MNSKVWKIGRLWILVSSTAMTGVAHASCTPTPDCATIGYTETSCEGDSLKCPFDITKLYCIPCDSSFKYDCNGANEVGVGEICNGKYASCIIVCDEAYKYSCDGDGYAGGVGESCDGLYKECSCTGGWSWSGYICDMRTDPT